ncbi:hypothetical protein B0T16DRAFT_428431 [Cercophora newfieldiana]|uniref:MARVEL domain-containing protein n=1 Tax=Cercophora newfieldiana TaxID=92897 RepID=A0AA39YCP3_9PEZI|nr:hypothetical protein B0T16DRAFT_428431 [Cercophora newfieldiana]
MGSTSKACNVILRIWELVCSAVVLGIVAKFINLVIRAGGQNDSRLIYTLIVASISTLYSLLFMPPFLYTFLAFPADFILFVMWLIAFCLLVTRVATNTCNALWYSSYWGYYWGDPWVWTPEIGWNATNVGYAGCSQWRAVLAFSFMASITFLISSILGLIVVVKHYGEGRKSRKNP